MKICGIYTVTNILDGKIYVGYSDDIDKRFTQHKSQLSCFRHRNRYLQRAWNKYGEKVFEFEVLEECEEIFLVALEHYWCTILRVHDRRYGYNIRPTHPYQRSNSHSIESRIRISDAFKKPVVVLDLKGRLLNQFDSFREASIFLNIELRNVSDAIRKYRGRFKNFLFILKSEYNPNLEYRHVRTDNRSREILALNIKTNEHEEFKNVKEFMEKMGLTKHNYIYKTLLGERAHCNGYKLYYKPKLEKKGGEF